MSDLIGPTGKYTHGSLGPHDKGELRSGIYLEGGKIVLEFGATVTFVAMTVQQARELCVVLSKFADRLEQDK